MNILFAVDEYPFPPRNGVTLPIANFIDLFSAGGHRVDMLHWALEETAVDALPSFSKGVGIEVRMKRARFMAAAKESIGRAPAFVAWEPAEVPPLEQIARRYDAVWASPIRSLGLFERHRSRLGLPRPRVLVAAINDIYSLTLKGRSGVPAAGLLGGVVDRWRARIMPSMEKRLLNLADLIVVQSAREVDWLHNELPMRQADVVELKNGVSAACFAARASSESIDILFVGILDDYYRQNVRWFINNVYFKFAAPRPSFTIIGRGASDADISMYRAHGIAYHPFVEDIAAAYLSAKVLIAPVFKGFGTINKVIEAMAAGCSVVGDATAFNGITDFVPGFHAVVAQDAGGFHRVVAELLKNKPWREQMGGRARDLMRRHYDWQSRFREAECRILEVLSRSPAAHS